MAVKEGDTIKLEYVGKFQDGTVFDDSERHGQPLEFKVGAKQVVKGFDDAVRGMKKDEEKEFTLKPKDAYGDINTKLIQKVPKDKIPDADKIKEGMVLGMQLPTGQQVPARVAEVTDTDITIDLNPPLAGKELTFKVKIVDIS